MNAQDQARALMHHHHHAIKNRQQSMLGRAAAEVGLSGDSINWNHIQGKPYIGSGDSYDRSGATLS